MTVCLDQVESLGSFAEIEVLAPTEREREAEGYPEHRRRSAPDAGGAPVLSGLVLAAQAGGARP